MGWSASPKTMSNGLLTSGNYCKTLFRRQKYLNLLQLLKNNFIHTTSSFTIKYKWLFRLQMCLRVCLQTSVPFLHLWTFIPSNRHTHINIPGKAGLECISTANVVVWAGKHCDPDIQVIHLSTLR